jgi:hypothetical protein
MSNQPLFTSRGLPTMPHLLRLIGKPCMPQGRKAIPIYPTITTHTELNMPKTTPEQTKAIALEAFDTLFNKRDYAAAEQFWSPKYI